MGTFAPNMYGADTLGRIGLAVRGRQRRPWPFTSDRLANRLVQDRVLLPATASTILREAVARGISIFSLARSVASVSAEALRDAAAAEFGIEIADLSLGVDPSALRGVPTEIARANLILPLRREGDRLVVAVADPTLAEPLRAINRAVGLMLDLRLATTAELVPLVAQYFNPTLAVTLPDGKTLGVSVPQGDLTIGRAATNGLALADSWTSSLHAVLRSQETFYRIVDLGSRNGVFVNGDRIVGSRLLQHGDVIRIGLAQIEFSLPISDRPSEPAAGAAVPVASSVAAPVAPPHAVPPPPAADETEDTEASEKEHKASARMRAARITFAGRVIAQIFTVLAALIISAVLFGSMPTSCSPNALKVAEPGGLPSTQPATK